MVFVTGWLLSVQGRQYSRSRRSSSSSNSRSRSEVAVSRPEIRAWMRGQGGPGSPKALPMKPTTRAALSGSRMRKLPRRSPPGSCGRRLRNGSAAKEGAACSRAWFRPCSSNSAAVIGRSELGFAIVGAGVSTTAGRFGAEAECRICACRAGDDVGREGVDRSTGSMNNRRKRAPFSDGRDSRS